MNLDPSPIAARYERLRLQVRVSVRQETEYIYF